MTINVAGSNITFSDNTVQSTAFISPLAISQGGLNLTATPTNGQIPIGNGTGYTLSTITGGTGINITNASGSVTVNTALPFFAFGTTGGF